MKNIVPKIAIIILVSNCACLPPLHGTAFQEQLPRVFMIPIELKSVPRGTVCFTGFQCRFNYGYTKTSDDLTEHFIENLNKDIANKFIVHHYSEKEISEYAIFVRNHDRVTLEDSILGKSGNKPMTTAHDQIAVVDQKSSKDKILLVNSCRDYLNNKVGSDYYLSVTGDIISKYDEQKGLYSNVGIFAVSLYDKNGEKLFCRMYGDTFKNYVDPESGIKNFFGMEQNKTHNNKMAFLDAMLVFYKEEMNKDLAFIKKM
jgi:hypothetical protein